MNLRTIVFPLALALAACQPGISPRSTVDLIADVVKIELPIILPSLNPAQQADVTRYAGDVEAARQAIDAALVAGKPISAQTLVLALQGLAPIVSANVAPNSPAAIAIASAVALAPLILAESGVVGAAGRTLPVEVERNKMVLRGVGR